MNIRRICLSVFLLLLFPLPSWTQSTWGRPSGLSSTELFSAGELKTVILMFLAAVFLLGSVFLLSTFLSAREVLRLPGVDGSSRQAARTPDLHAGNPPRTAVVRRLHPSPALLAARNEAEKSKDAPSRPGEEAGRG